MGCRVQGVGFGLGVEDAGVVFWPKIARLDLLRVQGFDEKTVSILNFLAMKFTPQHGLY